MYQSYSEETMRRTIPAILLILITTTATLSAQPIWIGADQNHAFTFEWQKPMFDNGDGVGLMMSSIFLGYRTRTSQSLSVVLDLPVANYDYDSDAGEFLLGNPYVGLAFGSEDAKFSGDVGVRLPISDEDKVNAAVTGILSDFDRLEAFASKAVPVIGIMRFKTMFPASKLGVRAHFGPSILVYTNDRGSDDMTVYLKYGLIGMYKGESVLAQLGFSGIYNASNEYGSFEDNSMHHFGITINVDAGAHIWPGLLLRIPMDDDLKRAIDAILGVNVMVML
jgi:hypothetical protein